MKSSRNFISSHWTGKGKTGETDFVSFDIFTGYTDNGSMANDTSMDSYWWNSISTPVCLYNGRWYYADCSNTYKGRNNTQSSIYYRESLTGVGAKTISYEYPFSEFGMSGDVIFTGRYSSSGTDFTVKKSVLSSGGTFLRYTGIARNPRTGRLLLVLSGKY